MINGNVSYWASDTIGIPKGFVLGFLLFIYAFVHKWHWCWTNNYISKLAHSMKIRNSAIVDCDRLCHQEDLQYSSSWFDRWEMPFNVNKCHTIKQKYDYEINVLKLESVQCVTDNGSYEDAEFNTYLDCINTYFSCENKDTILSQRASLIRPYL